MLDEIQYNQIFHVMLDNGKNLLDHDYVNRMVGEVMKSVKYLHEIVEHPTLSAISTNRTVYLDVRLINDSFYVYYNQE